MNADRLPADFNLKHFESLAADLVKAYDSGDADARQRLRDHFGVKRLLSWEEVRQGIEGRLTNLSKRGVAFEGETGRLTVGDAHIILAEQYGFEDWGALTLHIAAMNDPGSVVSQFEAAVEAVITGDAKTLEGLLQNKPDLIRVRSTRIHHATMLHYVSANGVEGYRQKTPPNIVAITEFLLGAGAEVDAVGKMYGVSTTLGLAATSVHPWLAGVQEPLMQILLDHGATLEGPLTPDCTIGSIVNACLANGRGPAAAYLADRGAHLDLEGAAGVGRLDRVQSFFNEDGSLKSDATRAQMEAGFLWACEYGHNNVVEFLLDQGLDVQTGEMRNLTGLHWAALGGQIDTIKLLLKRGAKLEALNLYNGTVLCQAIWCAYNGEPNIDYAAVLETLIQAGARVDVYPQMKDHIDEILKANIGRARGRIIK